MPVVSPDTFEQAFDSLPASGRRKFVRDLWESRGYTITDHRHGYIIKRDGNRKFLVTNWNLAEPILIYSTPSDYHTTDPVESYRIADLATQLNYAIAPADARLLLETYFDDIHSGPSVSDAPISVLLIALIVVSFLTILFGFSQLPSAIDNNGPTLPDSSLNQIETSDSSIVSEDTTITQPTNPLIPAGIGQTGVTDLNALLDYHNNQLLTTSHRVTVSFSGGATGPWFNDALSGTSTTVYNNQTHFYSRSEWHIESADGKLLTHTTEEFRSGSSLHLKHTVRNESTIQSSHTFRFKPDEATDLSSNTPFIYQDITSVINSGFSSPGTSVDHVTIDDDGYSIIALDGRIREFGDRANYSPPIQNISDNYYRVSTQSTPSDFPVEVDAYRAVAYVTGNGTIVGVQIVFVRADNCETVTIDISMEPVEDTINIEHPQWYPGTSFESE